jgi:alpha-tubulin suppressor-like RCC1 family protein
MSFGHGFLLEPGGTLQAWHKARQLDSHAIDAMGLGDNRPLEPYTLIPVAGLKGVVKVAAGSSVSFAVLADGRLLSWGLNAGNGLLGTTPRSVVEVSASWGLNSNVPVPLAVAFEAVDVCTQDLHALALARDGTVYAWGRGDLGQLGIGPLPIINFKTRTPAAMSFVPFPVRIPGLTDVMAIGAGRRHGLALLKDGTVRAWGENRSGQVGDGTTLRRGAPVPVPGVRNAVAIATGTGDLSAALLADGTVMTWGGTDEGGLGRTPFNKSSPSPAVVPGVRGVRAIAVGSSHMIALTETGSVITWGNNGFGSLGRPKDEHVPGVVPSVTNVQSICASNTTSVAVLASGRIMTWGGEVRPWNRPEGSEVTISRSPILFWLDGLDLP